MTKTTLITIAMLIAASASASMAEAQTARSLDGLWRQDDGSVTVRIADCPRATSKCATVTEERAVAGQSSLVNQTVVQDMRPDGARRWRGRYVVDGQSMNATARLVSTDTLTVRVCAIAFLCDTIRLNRVR